MLFVNKCDYPFLYLTVSFSVPHCNEYMLSDNEQTTMHRSWWTNVKLPSVREVSGCKQIEIVHFIAHTHSTITCKKRELWVSQVCVFGIRGLSSLAMISEFDNRVPYCTSPSFIFICYIANHLSQNRSSVTKYSSPKISIDCNHKTHIHHNIW